MTKPRVAVLSKRTSYRKFALDDADPLVTGLLQKDDVSVRRMRGSHEDHEATVREVRAALDELGAHATFQEGPRSRIHGTSDLVVTVGGDGTLLSASHQVGPETPLIGVNSAPDHSVGFFCAAKKGGVLSALRAALDGSLKRVELSRMRVELNGRAIHSRVLNEALFCHASPAATSRYILRLHDANGALVDEEEQRSSGMWIGPAAGSTAAQKSAGGRVLPLTSRKVQYVVREPYTPYGEPLRLVVGLVEDGGHVEIRNKTREAKIFLDGHHTEFDSTLGDVITMRRSDEPLTVLGLTRNGGRRT
jgi:NAD+ kinase